MLDAAADLQAADVVVDADVLIRLQPANSQADTYHTSHTTCHEPWWVSGAPPCASPYLAHPGAGDVCLVDDVVHGVERRGVARGAHRGHVGDHLGEPVRTHLMTTATAQPANTHGQHTHRHTHEQQETGGAAWWPLVGSVLTGEASMKFSITSPCGRLCWNEEPKYVRATWTTPPPASTRGASADRQERGRRGGGREQAGVGGGSRVGPLGMASGRSGC